MGEEERIWEETSSEDTADDRPAEVDVQEKAVEAESGDMPTEPAPEEKPPEPKKAEKKAKRKKRKRKTKKKAIKKKAVAPDKSPAGVRGGAMGKASPREDNLKLIAGAVVILVVLAAIILLTRQDTPVQAPGEKPTPTTIPSANPNVAEKYDIVTVEYTGSLKNGTVFDTSMREVAEEHGVYNPLRTYDPLTFTLGYGGLIKGFEEAIEGMTVGQEREVTLTPEQAYGERLDRLIQPIERMQSSPIVQNITVVKFIEDIGLEPHEGLEFTVPNRTGYEITWPMTVLAVENDTVTFRYEPNRNATVTTVFGEAEVYATEDEIIIEIDAIVGEQILTLAGPAEVIGVNEENITLDFNHPLAGYTLDFRIKLLAVTKQ